jgi:hypothetical protein
MAPESLSNYQVVIISAWSILFAYMVMNSWLLSGP